MSEQSIYSGPRSCYARNEGIYVAGGPMDLAKAAAHLMLHLRDLERGWTYDHDCKRIRMTIDLFEARSKYLAKICEKQGGSDCEKIRELVEYVLDNMALPDWAEKIAEGKIIRHAALF